MIKKLPWPEILLITLTLAAGAGVYVWAHRDEGSLEESKRRGAAIVQALGTYEAEHGTYPDSLAQLVPAHLLRIEPPTWGLERWVYRRYTPAEVGGATTRAAGDVVYFQLSVAASPSGYPVLYYDIAAARWVLNN